MPPNKLTIHPPRRDSPSGVTRDEEADATAGATDEVTGYISPVAPPFSPLTPKTQPAFLALNPLPTDGPPVLSPGIDSNIRAPQHGAPRIPMSEYIPQPPPQPFSSEESTDAAALRAAISTLQFQRKKAQDDIKILEEIRKKAVEDPKLFKDELAAGRLKEQKPTIGDLRAILDASDSEDDEEAGEEMEDSAPFASIPGPQSIVRMPISTGTNITSTAKR